MAVTSSADERSTADLLKDFSDQITHLVRDELQLARAELEAKGKRFGFGAGLFGAAGVLAVYAGGALLLSLVLLLALVVPAWVAALIVGVVVAAAAAVLAMAARGQLRKAAPPVPEQTVTSVRQDIKAVKEGARR
jgi:Putative Actinobacterial Holin-X, holin superfamily III